MSAEVFSADITKWAQQLHAHMDEYVRNCTFEAAENIVIGGKYSPGTPVDTGFARNSWGANIGTEAKPRLNPETDGRGLAGLAEMEQVMARVKAGDVVTIATNCVYMNRLEHGHSQKQAPQGMIRLTAMAWPQITEDIAREMGAV